MLTKRFPLLRLLPAILCLLLPARAPAQEDKIPAWLLPGTLPPGGNSAVVPTPRDEWLMHFMRSVEVAHSRRTDLVFDGDSITDFWLSKGKAVWDKNYVRLNAVDFGIAADRTENLLWRLEHGQVAGLHPRMVVLLIGTNNLLTNKDEQIVEGVTAVVHAYQKLCPDATILLQGIFPRDERAATPFRQRIKAVNAGIAKLGDGNKVVYVDFGDKFLEPDGTLSKEVMPDALHPSARGYEIWADAIRPQIVKVFGAAAQ